MLLLEHFKGCFFSLKWLEIEKDCYQLINVLRKMLTSDDILVKINGKYKSMFQNAIDQ